MSWTDQLKTVYKTANISWFDLIVLIAFFLGGWIYLHDALFWGIGWIGHSQYGDAEFWWNGALHVAQGIFQDNPGKGFRPGYFLLTGLTLPVLGQQFQQFYPYFVTLFLAISGLFYLALRPIFGRLISTCIVAMLIFNPYTAEWIATSTTDSTGLMLNIAALSCLLFGVNKNFNRLWLVMFAIFFALATLTRPLMTPFIGIVLLTLLFIPHIPFKKKVTTVALVFIAFCLPTLMWMTIQKLTIDRWALSSNDASAFYAASDPAIQVWNNEMYVPIKKLSAERHHVPLAEVDEQMLNQTFWEETIHNYFKYPKYHIKRLLPHVFEIARFSPKQSTHGTLSWQTFFMAVMGSGLAAWLWLQRRKMRALVLLAVSAAIILWDSALLLMTLAGMFFALSKYRRKDELGIFFLGVYWVVGVIALYLVGGTFGSPSFSPQFALNALGYRLGSQVFFAGDILSVYCLVCLAYFNVERISSYNRLLTKPSSLASATVLGGYATLSMAVIIVYVIGGYTVIQRSYALNHAKTEAYPSLDPVMKLYKQRIGYNLEKGEGQQGGLNESIFSKKTVKAGIADVIFTGTVSSFIWNMPGQPRAQIMTHTQHFLHPYTMGPGFKFLDVPTHVNEKEWIGKQGAFIIRSVPDHHNESNQAYYLTTPALRAFVPVASDGKSFDLSKVIWFPLSKNATQLESSGELKYVNTKITWAMDSGSEPYQRRFFLIPHHDKAQLLLNVEATRGPTVLSFSYAPGDIPGTTQAKKIVAVNISTVKKGSVVEQPVITNDETNNDATIKKIELPISSDTKTVKITFNDLLPGTGIWIYEFNLSANDFVHLHSTKRGV